MMDLDQSAIDSVCKETANDANKTSLGGLVFACYLKSTYSKSPNCG